MKVKDIVGISSVEVTIAISEDEGATFHSFYRWDNKIMNSVVNNLSVKNGIAIIHIDKVDRKVKCWCCNNENVFKGYKCNNCGEVV